MMDIKKLPNRRNIQEGICLGTFFILNPFIRAQNQRLIIGKILLVICVPVFIVLIVLDNLWHSILYYGDLLKADFKTEWSYFKEYITMRSK